MGKFFLNIRHTNKRIGTELDVVIRTDTTEQQDNQSPKGLAGLVVGCTSLVISVIGGCLNLIEMASYLI